MNDVASLASLLADPARARMLMALMSGTALTATELATEAGVAPSTASSHLAKLTDAQLLTIEKQGRHRYFRLFDDEIASMIEGIHGIATREPKRRGPADPALRHARVCYDHLAGERGVWLFEQLRNRNLLTATLAIPKPARRFFTDFGIDLDALATSRRPLCRTCLDWSERR
ncbi:MAG TPA: winged helix-turn-helix domain-containing protein, partial [Thermoanaerobaculia bacterium]